jgi:hypothetical protein
MNAILAAAASTNAMFRRSRSVTLTTAALTSIRTATITRITTSHKAGTVVAVIAADAAADAGAAATSVMFQR